MVEIGGDVPGMRQLASRMGSVASRLDAMRNRLNGQIESTVWRGPDADRFRDQWRSTYVTALRQMVADLQDAAASMRREADTQERVSNT